MDEKKTRTYQVQLTDRELELLWCVTQCGDLVAKIVANRSGRLGEDRDIGPGSKASIRASQKVELEALLEVMRLAIPSLEVRPL